MSRETRSDYFNSVKSTVEEIFSDLEIKTQEDFEDKRDEVYDRVHEEVDGSGWIIYYSSAQDVLQFSENHDAYLEQGMEIDTSQGFLQICTQCAFWAMYQDIMEEIETQKDDLPESEEEVEEETEESVEESK